MACASPTMSGFCDVSASNFVSVQAKNGRWS
jgi:hypothetical protein